MWSEPIHWLRPVLRLEGSKLKGLRGGSIPAPHVFRFGHEDPLTGLWHSLPLYEKFFWKS
jgi:hypothetical protein